MTCRQISAPLIGLVISTLLVFGGHAAESALPSPMVIPHGTNDVTKTVAGDYTLDPNHVGVIARVSHLGFSISIFRFDKAAATLKWDPTAISRSQLTATVTTASITSNVPGFAADLSQKYLLSAQYPEATFVSTALTPPTPPMARSTAPSRSRARARHSPSTCRWSGPARVSPAAR
jgi:polyisoprenoid-binding protein YceI